MSGSGTPSDGKNSGVFSDDGSYGFTHRELVESKCRTCPEISSVRSPFDIKNQSVQLAKHGWHPWRRDRPRISGKRNGRRSLRRSRRSALLSRERLRDNSLRITNGKNGWLITANKGSQTTGPTASSASVATNRPVWMTELVTDHRLTGYVPESTRGLDGEETSSRILSASEKKSGAKLSSAGSSEESSISRGGTGLSVSDSVLAIPEDHRGAALTFRQRKQRQDSDSARREAELLRCRQLTSSHRVTNLGNEVDQILTRKRSAAVAMRSVGVSPDRKKRFEASEATVELLWKLGESCTIKSGDDRASGTEISEKSSKIPEAVQLTRRPGTTRIVEAPPNRRESSILLGNQTADRDVPEDDGMEEATTAEETTIPRNLSMSESQESVKIIEVRENSGTNQFFEEPRRVRLVTRGVKNRDARTGEDVDELTIISMKKEHASIIVLAEREELDSPVKSLRHGRRSGNVAAMDNDDDDYHFLMSLYNQLRKMHEAKKLKMKLRMQTMFCDEIESDSGSSRSRAFP